MSRGYQNKFRALEPKLQKKGTAEKKLASLGVRPMGELTDDSYAAFESATGGPKFKNDRDNPASLINAELNMRNDLEAENCAVFDGETGEPIIAKSDGHPSSLDFSMAQIHQMRKLNGRAIFTHNHPGNSSFSEDDIHLLIGGNIAEFRISSQRYAYVMTDPSGKFRNEAFNYKNGRFKGDWNLDKIISEKAKVESEMTDADRRKIMETALKEASARGTDLDYEMRIASTHAINERLLPRLGLTYKRIPITASK